MKERIWHELGDGDIIWNMTDGFNKVKVYGRKVYLASCDKDGNETGGTLFPIGQFNCKEWDEVKDGVIWNE